MYFVVVRRRRRDDVARRFVGRQVATNRQSGQRMLRHIGPGQTPDGRGSGSQVARNHVSVARHEYSRLTMADDLEPTDGRRSALCRLRNSLCKDGFARR